MNEQYTSISALVESSIARVPQFAATLAGREDEPAMVGYVDYGVPWYEAACQQKSGLSKIEAYRANVGQPSGSTWMDNTTIFTACTLTSEDGMELMTPLTVWDLATFMRAAVCYDHIYHHEHPDINDAEINRRLGSDVMIKVPLPLAYGDTFLPDPWDGAHRFMCDVWFSAAGWMKRLNQAIGRGTLDGRQIEAVTEAWRSALDRRTLRSSDLVNYETVDRRWRSPSDQLLIATAGITDALDTTVSLDPSEGTERVNEMRRAAGLKDFSSEFRSEVLSDLNLRSYINQRLAEFFELPYTCSLARAPFRNALYDRSLSIQQELVSARFLDDWYADLAGQVQLRLPVFLALALRSAEDVNDLWDSLRDLRTAAVNFREHRIEFDKRLARRDLKELKELSKALSTSVEDLLALAGDATSEAGTVMIERVSKGDVEPVSTAVSVGFAAVKGLLKSSLADRVLWRLRRPELLWLNNIADQAQHLTEAIPDFARLWKLSPKLQSSFAARFSVVARHLS